MKKEIDELIKKHEEEPYKKYIMLCSIKDFKELQRLLSEEYKIKDYQGGNSIWRHVAEPDQKFTEGTARFDNFELNVYRSPKIYYGYTIAEMKKLPLFYMDIFKNSKLCVIYNGGC